MSKDTNLAKRTYWVGVPEPPLLCKCMMSLIWQRVVDIVLWKVITSR